MRLFAGRLLPDPMRTQGKEAAEIDRAKKLLLRLMGTPTPEEANDYFNKADWQLRAEFGTPWSIDSNDQYFTMVYDNETQFTVSWRDRLVKAGVLKGIWIMPSK